MVGPCSAGYTGLECDAVEMSGQECEITIDVPLSTSIQVHSLKDKNAI